MKILTICPSLADEKFDDLCFQLGIELDEITSERQLIAKEQGTEKANKPGLSDAVLYRIEVPANRYDMLSIEGITRAIRIFITGEPCPVYTVVPGKISVKVSRSVFSKYLPLVLL